MQPPCFYPSLYPIYAVVSTLFNKLISSVPKGLNSEASLIVSSISKDRLLSFLCNLERISAFGRPCSRLPLYIWIFDCGFVIFPAKCHLENSELRYRRKVRLN